MAELLLGPLVRWVDDHAATVWVEVDRACDVTVLGATTPTFEVAGHHVALVVVDLDGRDQVTPYAVALDGALAWPLPDDPWPDPVLRRPGRTRTRIAFGSCRAAAPDEAPWNLLRSEHPDGLGVDALAAFANELREADHVDWPDLLLMLGDQVYADDASPATRAFARARRDTSQEPGEDVADFEEYTRLYRESWTVPSVRWLLSTVPTAMIFDDHDVIDDWNISASWIEDMRATSWWHDRIVGALASYWVYQHLGNLSPELLAEEPLLRQVRAADGDAAHLVFAFAEAADRDPGTARWSHQRRIGDVELLVVDSRAGRTFTEDGRDMLDEREWQWLAEHLAEPAPHVLLATTLPVLLPHAIHDVEVWNANVCDGRWGRLAARAAEGVRRAVDLEHWAAFPPAHERLLGLLRPLVEDPGVTTVALLSGDVHHGSVDVARWEGVEEPLWQVVASPLRQEVEVAAQRVFRAAATPGGRALGTALRRLARGTAPALRWSTVEGPVFANHLGVVEVDADGAVARLREAHPDHRLHTVVERRLTGTRATVPTAPTG